MTAYFFTPLVPEIFSPLFPHIFSISLPEISINTTNFELEQKRKGTRLLYYEGINYSSHEAL